MAKRKASAKIVNPKTTTSEKRYGKNGEYDAVAVQDFVAAVRDKGYQPTKEEQAVIDEYIADVAADEKSEPSVETNAKDAPEKNVNQAQPNNAAGERQGEFPTGDTNAANANPNKMRQDIRVAGQKAGETAEATDFNVGGMEFRSGLTKKKDDTDNYIGKSAAEMPYRNPAYDGREGEASRQLATEVNRTLMRNSKEIIDLKKKYPDFAAAIDKGIDEWDGGGVGAAKGNVLAFNFVTNLESVLEKIAKLKKDNPDYSEYIDAAVEDWERSGAGILGNDVFKYLSDLESSILLSRNNDNAPPIAPKAPNNANTDNAPPSTPSGNGGTAGGEPLTIDDVRKMTPDEYQAGPSAAQVVQVMKDAGLSKEEAIKELARLSATSKTGTISQIGMGALNSIYGAGRNEGGADNAAQAEREPSSTPIRDEVIADDKSGALVGMQQAREGIAEELLANADDPKLREELTKYVDEVRRNYQAVEPETRNLVYMNMFDAYKKGLWGDPKSDDPQERKEAKLGLTFAILGQLGKIMSQFGKDVGKIGGHDIGGGIEPTAFDTIQRKGIEQAMEERRQYREGKLKAEMDAAGFGPELQAQALETFAKWKNNPETMPLAQALDGNKQLYAFQMSQILGDRLMKDPTVAQLVGLMALGKIDGEAVKGVLMTRTGQEVVGMLKDWADKNPNGLFSGFIGTVAGKAASIIGE